MNYLKLIRFYNLLIMALTMYAIRWFIIFPVLKSYGYSLQISEILFFLLVISTLTIAGGGYVINDYFDRKADRINDPKNVIVGTKIHRRFAIILHSVLNVVGVGLGFFVSIEIGHWKYGFIFLLTTGILWFYSTTYKRKFLIGNFVISLITAFIPLLVLFFETSMLKTNFSSTDSDYKLFIHYIYYIVFGFSFFAFLTSMTREIIKDIEDIRGDIRLGCRTLPIVIGVYPAKIIALVFTFLTIISIIFAYFFYISSLNFIGNDKISIYYIFMLIIILLFSVIMIIKASKTHHYKRISLIIKVIMFLGIAYSAIFYFLINNNLDFLMNA